MDVVICNFPPMLKHYLPAAPAVLAGACRWLNKSYVFLDFNQQDIDIERWSQQVLAYNPKIVALSVFSYKSREYAQQLADLLKSKQPNLQIVAGGSGIKNSINGDVLINTDYIIEGDGEYKWAKFLSNNVEQFSNLNAPYQSDFSGYDVANYTAHRKPWVPITGSRGCVRKCTFCEIHRHWNFQQRSSESIANEVRSILSIIPNACVHFTDSLVNGSLPAFNQLLDRLIDIKQQYPEFEWAGQFIIRNKKQSPEEYWEKIAQSGNSLLEIGVETGSDSLRAEMDKKFTNEDLDHSLNYIHKFGLKCVFLMFVGYPTETDDDFNQTLEMLQRYQKYAGNTIDAVQLGYNFSIHPGTPIYEYSNQPNSTIVATKYPLIWFNKANNSLTYEERLRRRTTIQAHASALGYTLSYDNDTAVQEAKDNYQTYHNLINLIERQK